MKWYCVTAIVVGAMACAYILLMIAGNALIDMIIRNK